MRYGFTGTRSVPEDRVDEVYDFIHDETSLGTEFTTGACVGFDALAARWLLKNAQYALVHRLCVPSNRSQVDADLFHEFLTASSRAWHEIELLPDGTDYRDRNKRILDHSDELIAVAEYPEHHPKSKRSGTWMTVRIARDRKIPIHLMVIHDD